MIKRVFVVHVIIFIVNLLLLIDLYCGVIRVNKQYQKVRKRIAL